MVVAGGNYLYGVEITSLNELQKLIDLEIFDYKLGETSLILIRLSELLTHDRANHKCIEYLKGFKVRLIELNKISTRNHKWAEIKKINKLAEEFIKNINKYLEFNKSSVDDNKSSVDDSLRGIIGDIDDITDDIFDALERVLAGKVQAEMVEIYYKLNDPKQFSIYMTPHEARWTDYIGNSIYFGVGTHICFGSGEDLSKIKLDKEMFDKFCSDNNLFSYKKANYEFIPDDCNCCS